jgi:P27 family predicted phage terminase small subunit
MTPSRTPMTAGWLAVRKPAPCLPERTVDVAIASANPESPRHLSRASKRWFRRVMADYELQEPGLRLLVAACEAWDRMVEAREAITTDGPYHRDRYEQLRPHPAITVERDCRIGFARLVRELGFDREEEPHAG